MGCSALCHRGGQGIQAVWVSSAGALAVLLFEPQELGRPREPGRRVTFRELGAGAYLPRIRSGSAVLGVVHASLSRALPRPSDLGCKVRVPRDSPRKVVSKPEGARSGRAR